MPKIIPKYTGPQEEIFVEVPQVKIVDKTVEREVPVYVGEKIVRKEVGQSKQFHEPGREYHFLELSVSPEAICSSHSFSYFHLHSMVEV